MSQKGHKRSSPLDDLTHCSREQPKLDAKVAYAEVAYSQTVDGKVVETPARFTLLITKNDQGWRISHFHSSVRPKP